VALDDEIDQRREMRILLTGDDDLEIPTIRPSTVGNDTRIKSSIGSINRRYRQFVVKLVKLHFIFIPERRAIRTTNSSITALTSVPWATDIQLLDKSL
jgi:hypothetical protein